MNSSLWWQFWQLAFVIAVSSFGLIAAVVAIRGFSDLRDLIRLLKRKQQTPTRQRQD